MLRLDLDCAFAPPWLDHSLSCCWGVTLTDRQKTSGVCEGKGEEGVDVCEAERMGEVSEWNAIAEDGKRR